MAGPRGRHWTKWRAAGVTNQLLEQYRLIILRRTGRGENARYMRNTCSNNAHESIFGAISGRRPQHITNFGQTVGQFGPTWDQCWTTLASIGRSWATHWPTRCQAWPNSAASAREVLRTCACGQHILVEHFSCIFPEARPSGGECFGEHVSSICFVTARHAAGAFCQQFPRGSELKGWCGFHRHNSRDVVRCQRFMPTQASVGQIAPNSARFGPHSSWRPKFVEVI